ncbi:hypothetical protein H4Q26_017815 [Puccinia striiformis f. sp. tritici PST-130]|uniref:Uncharacterized protein n=1 Tax=Puccinia striiformis f. sp. tritici PST-78 TaxID=1165861 RepID=A0A0L0UZ93_9BASI|nr:hypothetical protein H4Q26_002726 [Puccinia striiformis f. sp. tritici PST-130]KAI9626606.1 hypothetical protein H4Q26_017815 [Puccinia striiformis f. sp. tritici PST-130]KNE92345.1 hypothetical protein PSTG_14245 [Puccinia striiformis f. sp. tritici PST-78]
MGVQGPLAALVKRDGGGLPIQLWRKRSQELDLATANGQLCKRESQTAQNFFQINLVLQRTKLLPYPNQKDQKATVIIDCTLAYPKVDSGASTLINKSEMKE